MANSVHYNPTGQAIGNVQLAVARLGLREIRAMCMALGAMRVFLRVSDLIDLRSFWKHCLSAALSTRVMARLTGKGAEEQNDAFTAGLFHDIGILVLDQFFADDYRQVREKPDENEWALHETETNLLGIDHGEVGGLLLAHWKIPDYICNAVIFHHEPDRAPPEHKGLCQIVHLADFAVASTGLWEPGAGMPRGFSEGAWHDLGLGIEAIPGILKEVEQEAETAGILASLGLR
jgi:HD-like signal output (HDOD) protein